MDDKFNIDFMKFLNFYNVVYNDLMKDYKNFKLKYKKSIDNYIDKTFTIPK